MKRLFIVGILLFTTIITACAQRTNKKEDNKMKKTLVAYFSATGITEKAAKDLAKFADADLYQIRPEKDYTKEDLDWTNKQSRSSIEMADKNSKPDIIKDLKNLGDYDVVYIGYPIWWHTNPKIINTFLESYDFKGETVIPFATSGGSKIDKSCEDLKSLYPELKLGECMLLNSYDENLLKTFINRNH